MTPSAPGSRVLLVDDRQSNLLALAALLEPLDCELVLAASGEEALQRLLEGEFSVILLDVQLPGMDGFEVATLIQQRERTRHIPIIFLTAALESSSALQGYAVGAVDFVTKPFDPVLLRSKVRSFLELAQANAAVHRQAAELAAALDERDATAALLAAQAEELQRSNQELEGLAAIASQDLSEPLRVLAGYSELLLERCQEWGDSESAQITGAIHRGVGRMQRLIDGLLQYARAGAHVAKARVAVSETVAEVLLSLEALIEDREAVIEVADLPTVVYNRVQLSQVLQSLISNAVKFVPPGRRPTVEISAARLNESWAIAVADNGIGVSDQDPDRLFTMMSPSLRGDGRQDDGSIGLAVCGRVVESNGGSIHVSNRRQGGAIFTFTIPDAMATGGPHAAE